MEEEDEDEVKRTFRFGHVIKHIGFNLYEDEACTKLVGKKKVPVVFTVEGNGTTFRTEMSTAWKKGQYFPQNITFPSTGAISVCHYSFGMIHSRIV